jgi:hypothetical protein
MMANDPTDELQIRNIIARLAHAADMAGEDQLDTAYVPLFTEDAVWEALPGALGPSAIRNEGIAAIRAAAVDRRRAGTSGPAAGSMHLVTTTALAIAGDEASGLSCFMVIGGADRAITAAARYEDRFRRVDGQWRLAHRTVRPR